MQQQMTTFFWLKVPANTRARIKEVFGLTRSGGSIVQNMGRGIEVVSDGYTDQDLSEITVEKMQKYLKSKETEFWKLFSETQAKIEEILKKEEELEREKAKAIV